MNSRRKRPPRVTGRSSTPRPSTPARSRLVVPAVLLVLVTFAAFAPVRNFEFVHYDDFEFVVENPNVSTGLTMDNVRWAVLENPYGATGGPVTWLSHMLDIELFGLDPGPHHLTSVVVHTATALLLLAVLHMTTGSTWRSGMVAALFAVHPLHVESVAWIAERKDVLSGFFWFATTTAYVGYVRSPGAVRYGAVIALFILGLGSKPMIVTLPFVLLLMDVWPLGRVNLRQTEWAGILRLVAEKVPMIALGAIVMFLTLQSQAESGAVSPLEVVPLSLRLSNASVSYVAYLGKTLWPVGLIPYYPYRLAIAPAVVASSVALLLVLTLSALAVVRRAPYLAVGWFWYLGTLVPVIGLVQVGGHAMADRFTYIPLTGIFVAAVWGARSVLARLRVPRQAVPAIGVAVIVALAAVTRAQAMHWRNGLALWEHTVRVDPGNARAHANLGVVLAGQHRLEEAIAEYRTAIRLQPWAAQPHSNLGLALEAAGRPEEAIGHFAEAVRLKPDYVKPRAHLATLLAQTGRTDDALDHFEAAIRLAPADPMVRVNFAVTLGRAGRPAAALPHMLEAVRLQPREAQWRYFAALMLLEMERREEAIEFLQQTMALDPRHEGAANTLAALRAQGSGQ